MGKRIKWILLVLEDVIRVFAINLMDKVDRNEREMGIKRWTKSRIEINLTLSSVCHF